MNVHRAIESYRCLVSKSEGLELKETLLQLADYAHRHGRTELAIDSYQHAYSMIEEVYDSAKDGFHTLRKR
jgi:hypothetical protein